MSSASSEKKVMVGKLPIGFKPEVPPPVPAKKLIIGPAMIALGLSIGSGELIFWPMLSSKLGPVLLWCALISLFFQTLWTLEMSRWTVWTGEHWVLQMCRWWGVGTAVTVWAIFTFLAWGFGGWAAAAGKAIQAVTHVPHAVDVGTFVWSMILFIIVWLVVLLAGTVREWVEWILTVKMFIIWIMLIIALVVETAVVGGTKLWGPVAKGIFVPHWPSEAIPSKLPYFTLAAAICFIGAGGTTNMWYSFWIRDAGYGMGAYIGRIPGFLRGKPVAIELTGYLPEPTEENIRRIKKWWSNVKMVFWIIFFILNYITAVFFVVVVYGGKILGLVKPVSGVSVIMLEAGIVRTVFHHSYAMYVFFIIVASILLFGAQLSLSEGVVRQIADTTYIGSERIRRFFKNDIRREYFWVMVLWVIWNAIWLSTITLAHVKPIMLLKLPANINLVYQVISAPLTVYFIYGVARKGVPKEIWEHMKPNPAVPVLLILGAIFWAYFVVMGWAELAHIVP